MSSNNIIWTICMCYPITNLNIHIKTLKVYSAAPTTRSTFGVSLLIWPLLLFTHSPLIRVVQNEDKRSPNVSSVIFVLIIFGCHDSKSIQFFVQLCFYPPTFFHGSSLYSNSVTKEVNVNYTNRIIFPLQIFDSKFSEISYLN